MLFKRGLRYYEGNALKVKDVRSNRCLRVELNAMLTGKMHFLAMTYKTIYQTVCI